MDNRQRSRLDALIAPVRPLAAAWIAQSLATGLFPPEVLKLLLGFAAAALALRVVKLEPLC